MSFEEGFDGRAEDARAARYSDLFNDRHEHGPECAACPICATLAVLRRTRPEVVEHIAAAARELVAAAAILVEEAEKVVGASERPKGATDSQRVRHIDIA